MWNETLKKLDLNKTPQLAISKWGGSQESLKLISNGINIVYRFEVENVGFYLRLTHPSLRTYKELESAIRFQQFLSQNDVPVCSVVPSKQNKVIESIPQGNLNFLAHVCSEVPGELMHYDHKNLEIYTQWGRSLAQFHLASQKYDAENFKYASWEKSFGELNSYISQESDSIKKLLEDTQNYFYSRFTNQACSKNYGLTHGDLREANVLTDRRVVNFIDFDLPCFNFFTEDLIRPFFHSIIHDQKNWKDKWNPYLSGYLELMPVGSVDLTSLVWHLKMKCLEIYLWTKNNWSSPIAPGGGNTQEWLDKIFQKMIQWHDLEINW